MIYLITGLPGNGKTLYALDFVNKLATKDARPVFYARIRGLKLPWSLIDPYEWPKCPANSIIVIDECQQSADPSDPKSPSLFGVRQRGAVVPPWAAALETHRHSGVDIVLITQDPMLLDAHDRKLVGVHFHVKRQFGMQRATIHEFNSCRPNVAASCTGSIRHEYSYNKDVFAWYESAEVHTMKRRVPARVWLLLALPFLIAGAVYYLWFYRLDPNRVKPDAVPVSAASGTIPLALGSANAGASRELTPKQYLASYEPRISGLDYSAPAFDHVTKPAVAPYPAACVSTGSRCSCYSQQATRLAVPDDLCRSIVERGFFVAWADGKREPRPVSSAASAASVPGRGLELKVLPAGNLGGRYARDLIADSSVASH